LSTASLLIILIPIFIVRILYRIVLLFLVIIVFLIVAPVLGGKGRCEMLPGGLLFSFSCAFLFDNQFLTRSPLAPLALREDGRIGLLGKSGGAGCACARFRPARRRTALGDEVAELIKSLTQVDVTKASDSKQLHGLLRVDIKVIA
jgi:hypothetical protein